MESKLKYIFLSDGYRGGASQFLNDHSNYLAKKNKDVILLDPNPQKTFEKLHKKIKVKKININDCNAKNKKILNDLINTKKKNSFLIISNFVFLIKYFLILSKFRKNNKIILTVHSGRLKKNFKFILLDFIFSLISKNVDFLIHGHTIFKEPYVIGNQHWIDTGVYRDCGQGDDHCLTIAEFKNGKFIYHRFERDLMEISGFVHK